MKGDESKETAEQKPSADETTPTTAAPSQPSASFPMMAVPYCLPPPLALVYPLAQTTAAVQPAFRAVMRFQSVMYLPTAWGYVPFGVDIIK
jgi:hypothetical protein